MATAVYATDLADINLVETAGGTTGWSALGGGASGLASETDYYIQGDGCISKAGFTATTKGMIYDATTTTVASGDAIFIWLKQNNSNLMDTRANGGQQVLIGSGTGDFDQFYVRGSDDAALDGWRNYAVDPTATPSTSTGSPTNTNFIGAQWKILGSGSLKGNPNGIDAFRHGRELQITEGFTVAEGTFAGAAAADNATSARWGIITLFNGTYQFHGAFVMGTTGTAVSFTDSDRAIFVLEDQFVLPGFNEFEIRHASSVVNWNNIQITALGTTAPFLLTLDVGTFTGDSCFFTGAGTTTFSSSQACTNSTWKGCGQITHAGANLSGSNVLTSTVAAGSGAVYYNIAADPDGEMDNMVFSQGAAAHSAIEFGTAVTASITLRGIDFTGFGSTDDVNGAVFKFLATSGSLNLNLVGCTTDGTFSVDDSAGITVTVVINPVTESVNVKDTNKTNIQNARVFIETAEVDASGEIYQAAVTSLTQSAGTATCTTTAVHGLVTNDKVVIRGAQPDGYNKVATVTVSSTTVFTYAVDSGLSSPATGTPVVSFVAIHGLTDASGNISASRTWTSAQALTGWARKINASSPFYKQADIAYTVDITNGNSTNVVLQPDE